MSRISRMLPLLIVGVTLAASLFRTHPVWAATAPLFFDYGSIWGGDIFSYTPAGVKMLSHYGYNNEPPFVSPNGKYLVYGSPTGSYVTAVSKPTWPWPINLWLMDTATGNAKRIADQPADTRAPGDAISIQPLIERGYAVWSPDSKALAWFEDAQGTKDGESDGSDHLKLYTLADGKTVEIYKQPGSDAYDPYASMDWTPNGLSFIYKNYPDKSEEWRLLNIHGQLISKITFDQLYSTVHWLSGETSPTIIADNDLITVNDQAHFQSVPPLEIYSLSAPNGIHFRSDAGYYDAAWTLIAPGMTPLKIGKFGNNDIGEYAISPDGKMAAWVDSSLHMSDGQSIDDVDLSSIKDGGVPGAEQPSGLAWSALAIRIATTP